MNRPLALVAALALVPPSLIAETGGFGSFLGQSLGAATGQAIAALNANARAAASLGVLAVGVQAAPAERVRRPRTDTTEAKLRRMGFLAPAIFRYHRRFGATNPVEAGLAALTWSHTYANPRRRVTTSDRRAMAWLEEDVALYDAARARFSRYSEISRAATPNGFRRFRREAAALLTNVPASRRLTLFAALLQKESVESHWVDFTPVVAYAGDVGFCQTLIRTARSVDANPFDPQENMLGAARYLNQEIGAAGSIAGGLARYNGGPRPGDAARQYARDVLAIEGRLRRGAGPS